MVDRVLGQWTDPLDEARVAAFDRTPAPVEPAGPGSMLDALARVGPDLGSAHLVAEALDREGISARDRELLLEYSFETQSGNASPASTVAPVFGMRAASVRQAARRARRPGVAPAGAKGSGRSSSA